MTVLRCGVGNCAYNEDHLCYLNVIQVGGEDAEISDNTICDSFLEQSKSDFTNVANSVEKPSEYSDIGCKAEKCVYNHECVCHADSIEIEGDYASDNHETCCSTFKQE